MTKFIGQRALQEKLDRGNTWIWNQVKKDPRFPKPVKHQNRNLWVDEEVEAYQKGLIAERDGQAA